MPNPAPQSIARRFLLTATLPWEIVILFPITACRHGSVLATEHTAFVVALTVFFAELLLVRFRKIPFTCLPHLDIKQWLTRILVTLFAVAVFVPLLANFERWMFNAPIRCCVLAILGAPAWHILRRLQKEPQPLPALIFEDSPPPEFELLRLAEPRP